MRQEDGITRPLYFHPMVVMKVPFRAVLAYPEQRIGDLHCICAFIETKQPPVRNRRGQAPVSRMLRIQAIASVSRAPLPDNRFSVGNEREHSCLLESILFLAVYDN